MKTKILLFVCLIAGLALLFSGCSENSLIPDTQNDEILKSKKIPTQFSGICTPIDNMGYDIISWYDATDDPRVTGVSYWVFTGIEPIDEVTIELTGTTEIFVGALTVEDVINGNYVGKWEMTWKGYQTYSSPESINFKIVAHGTGTGIEGEVLGLTARWKYTMDFDGTPESGAIYYSKGKISEEL
ncbi:hypothetical protein [Maribellus sediminis]|uniref:hypothetical protein n=1 Tax=Maribellus sediminis TaxID=2696285 RepID=UPI001430961F|nr:hypothetical protein [Maribellus sediminis]